MRYSKDELYEYKLDEFYLHNEKLARTLAEALSYLDKDVADTILQGVFFCVFPGGSCYFSKLLTRDRDVVILENDDLQDRKRGIITVLHEAAHHVFGHGRHFLADYGTVLRQEDEAWNKVREWLPAEFSLLIEEMELEGRAEMGKD